jgi:hypothetical protein
VNDFVTTRMDEGLLLNLGAERLEDKGSLPKTRSNFALILFLILFILSRK